MGSFFIAMVQENRFFYIFMIIALTLGIASCTRSSNVQTQAADSALKTLRKIEADKQVGIFFEEYDKLVTQANEQVYEASNVLPEGELKTEMNTAMDAYRDSLSVWKMQRNGDHLSQENELGKTLIAKYSLKTTAPFPGLSVTDYDEARAEIWKTAKLHLEKASLLFKQ